MSAANQNRCHWVLNVTFGEDHWQVRDCAAAQNLTILREMVIHTLHRKPSNPAVAGLRSKRKRAALNPDFRLQILALLHA